MTSRTGTQVTVTVPEDAPPGTVLAIPIKGGAETLKVRVPDGLGAGSTLLLTRPEGVEQWAMAVGKVVPPPLDAGGGQAEHAQEEMVNGKEDSDQKQKELEQEWLRQQAKDKEEQGMQGHRDGDVSPQARVDLPMASVAFTVRFETTVGTIDIVVRPDWAPHGTLRFLELAAAGDFDDRAFYRAVPGCIVQFGLPPKHELSTIPDDPPTGVPFLLGAVAFAAVGENTRRSTIFICTGDMSHCLGRQSWETPIGAVAESSLEAATLDRGCWGEAFHFVERAAERIIWRGLLFDEIETEVPILQDPGLSYEASLSVAADGYVNLPGYSELALSMHVMANYPHLLHHDDCVGARLLAHLFTARRQRSWPSDAGASILAEQSSRQSSAASGSSSMATFSIWERNLEPVFSESLKDPVLERIFGLIGVSSGYFVEVGTQSGEQCNTRYLRVRYGFSGLMVDDNFRNSNVNQKRRRYATLHSFL
eukprot:s352_g36.t1